jgi:uncharacterized membrane protein
MITIEKDVHINRPVADVFAFVADIGNDMKWQVDLIRSEQTSPGPVAVGSTGLYVQKFMGREMKNETIVTEFEPPKKHGFKTTSGPVQFEAVSTFEDMGGGTHNSIVIKGEPGGFFKIAEGLLAKELDKSMGRDLAKLKELLEA